MPAKRIPWNKGKKGWMTYTQEIKDKMSKSHLGVKRPYFTKENNPSWKGDNVGRIPLHIWIRKHLPQPALCQICKVAPSYDLANISGRYLRDLSDWQYICRSCHMRSDNRLYNNLKQYK